VFVPPIGHTKRTADRQEFRKWLIAPEHGWELSVTLAFNCPIKKEAARSKLGEWAQRVDHTYLGRGYRNKPDHRLYFVAIFENVHTNLHLHLLIRLPLVPWRRLRMKAFRGCRRLAWHAEVLERHWNKVMEPGSCDVAKIWDQKGIVAYATKQLTRAVSLEIFVLSTEFHTPGKRSENE
jgi:hypothetical protein